MATFLGIFHPGTDEWRRHRADKIGGSDVAAIVGLSNWQSAYALWHERRGQIEPGPDKPQMEWGTRLEPVIVQAFEERHPEFMVDYQPGQVWAHPDRPWQVASPDALLGSNPFTVPPTIIAGLEAKTSRYDDGWGPDGSADIPPYYSTQVQWCMDVFEVDTWHLAVLFSGSDYREYVIPAQPNLQTLLREAASDFLDSLTEDRVPPIDGHDTTYQAIRELHPDIDDVEIEVGDLGREWIEAVRAEAEAARAAKEKKALLADHMGRARRALLDGQRIAYRRNSKPGSPPYLTAVNGLLEKAV